MRLTPGQEADAFLHKFKCNPNMSPDTPLTHLFDNCTSVTSFANIFYGCITLSEAILTTGVEYSCNE